MPLTSAQLPEPHPEALRLSDALTDRIRAEIELGGGFLDFERYMQLALYEPGLGYYSAGSVKLGEHGDFVTAPELGDFLARALAHTLRLQFGRSDEAPRILEVGAGTGALAAQLLDALAESGGTRPEYRILEPGAELRDRQRALLARFGAGVGWLDDLPSEPFCGAILANEVVDALPVARFVKRGTRALPLGVTWRRGRLVWREGGEHARLTQAVDALERALGMVLPEGYQSEICLLLPVWIDRLAAALVRGSVLLVDYGMVRRDYYHPARRDGTLLCHYRHRAHGDPFLYPGLQDISAWVDFSACADAAAAAGLGVAGFTTQGQYLVASLASDTGSLESRSIHEIEALKRLVLPGEMGEHFKVLWLTKGLEALELPGRDLRDRL